MSVRYKKLSHILVERNITHSQLQRMVGYSANITSRLKKDEYVSLETIERICQKLDCTADDILEFDFCFQENDSSWC
mgnify:CR=1 FL=1